MLGPGLITGAADDDPCGIGTYAIAGASFGLATLWTALLTLPFMAAIQQIAARVGIVSGKGLGFIIRKHYSPKIVFPIIFLLLVSNSINLGVDLGAMANAFTIFWKIKTWWMVVPLGLLIMALQVFGSYRFIANTFKWLTLALFAYIIDAFIVKPNLWATLHATFIPTFSLEKNYLITLVAILGTTISPYLMFWQSSEEVEEEQSTRKAVESTPHSKKKQIRYSTIDTNIGMAVSNLVMYFIILSTAMTLNKSGINIGDAVDAAQALKPLAGNFAGLIFAIGMIGAGLLAIPVLSGSAAYALSEVLGWRRGLDEKWWRAKGFYAVITISTLVGMFVNFTSIKPIRALFWTSVLNGIVAPPILLLLMLTARNKKVMGAETIGPVLTGMGWTLMILMSIALLGLFG